MGRLLGRVQVAVGSRQDVGRRVGGEGGNRADADRQSQLADERAPLVVLDGGPHRLQDRRGRTQLQPGQDCQELVTPETGDETRRHSRGGVAGREAGLEQPAEFAHRDVPNLMGQSIVDVLEMVRVEHGHDHRYARKHVVEPCGQLLVHAASVR